MRPSLLPVVVVLTGATAALAQDATDDWAVIRQPERAITFAYVEMTSGLTLGFRCVDGVFGAVVAGLPPARRRDVTRPLMLRIRDRAERETRWSVTTDRTVAVADFPASLARSLREGGAVSIMIPGGGGEGRNLRHNLTLPASTAAVDETLTACGKPLVDARDELLPDIAEDGLPKGVNWEQAPRPRYPATTFNAGFAVLTCVVQPAGSLDQCEVESEFPLEGGFGRAALRAMPDARVTSPGETVGQYAPRMIGFRVNYRR